MAVITITVRALSGVFSFRRENPDRPLGEREYGSVYVFGKTYWGHAKRTAPGKYEFTI